MSTIAQAQSSSIDVLLKPSLNTGQSTHQGQTSQSSKESAFSEVLARQESTQKTAQSRDNQASSDKQASTSTENSAEQQTASQTDSKSGQATDQAVKQETAGPEQIAETGNDNGNSAPQDGNELPLTDSSASPEVVLVSSSGLNTANGLGEENSESSPLLGMIQPSPDLSASDVEEQATLLAASVKTAESGVVENSVESVLITASSNIANANAASKGSIADEVSLQQLSAPATSVNTALTGTQPSKSGLANGAATQPELAILQQKTANNGTAIELPLLEEGAVELQLKESEGLFGKAAKTLLESSSTTQAWISGAQIQRDIAGGATASTDALKLAVMGSRPGQAAWGDAVMQRINWMSSQQAQFAEIALDPPELGPLQVRIGTQQDQQTNILFTSHSSLVRDSLEQAIPRMREMLESQGINLGDVNVANQQSREGQTEPNSSELAQGLSGEGSVSEDDAAVHTAAVAVSTGLVDQYV